MGERDGERRWLRWRDGALNYYLERAGYGPDEAASWDGTKENRTPFASRAEAVALAEKAQGKAWHIYIALVRPVPVRPKRGRATVPVTDWTPPAPCTDEEARRLWAYAWSITDVPRAEDMQAVKDTVRRFVEMRKLSVAPERSAAATAQRTEVEAARSLVIRRAITLNELGGCQGGELQGNLGEALADAVEALHRLAPDDGKVKMWRETARVPPAPTALEQAAERWRALPFCSYDRPGRGFAWVTLRGAMMAEPSQAVSCMAAMDLLTAAAPDRWTEEKPPARPDADRTAPPERGIGDPASPSDDANKAAGMPYFVLTSKDPRRVGLRRPAPDEPSGQRTPWGRRQARIGSVDDADGATASAAAPPWLVDGARVRRKGTAREGVAWSDTTPQFPGSWLVAEAERTSRFTTAEMIEKFEPAPVPGKETTHG